MNQEPRYIAPLKILILSTYFPPEIGAAQTRIYELATQLKRAGHTVSVLTTFPNYPSGIVPEEWKGHFLRKSVDQGIRVYRIWSYASPDRRVLKRVIGYLSFAFFACLACPFLPSVDAILVESHPFFNGIAALFLKLVKRAPYVLNVSDLWPESAAQIGILKNRYLIWLLESLDRLAYKHASIILALTVGIRNKIIKDGIVPSKVRLFRNAVDSDFFRPGIDGSAARTELGLNANKFIVLYAGTFGMLNDVRTIVEAATIFQDVGNQRVHFVFAGDGAEKSRLQSLAKERGLANVTFIGACSKGEVLLLLNAADCACIALTKLNYSRGTLPRKLFEAMSAGKPIVLAAVGEAEQLVNSSGAGICVAPEDAKGIYRAILRLVENPEQAKIMSSSGRNCVTAHFCQQQRAKELSHYLQGLTGSAASCLRLVKTRS